VNLFPAVCGRTDATGKRGYPWCLKKQIYGRAE
jgi:hypothetical protein